MSLFAISDIHLSFGVENKNMGIFKGWHEHSARLRQNWNSTVGAEDTVVIGGDVSWGKSLDEALADLRFVGSLNGSKIILKGNHDYWWRTVTKMKSFLNANDVVGIEFLHNNAFRIGGVVLCGTRSWNADNFENCGISRFSDESDTKILDKECGRLESSVLAGLELGEPSEIAVFLHYPPVWNGGGNERILEILRKYSIKRVFSGHIHLSGNYDEFLKQVLIGEKYGIRFDMINADYLGFMPVKVKGTRTVPKLHIKRKDY
ncbi:MAG: metallophosphoesterase [Oscillospiraceae bacterium]|nr:metallophosphoesterase [Oscillospiraceae bacterium]